MQKLLFSVNETAALLGVKRNKVYDLINEGELERLKLGTRSLISDTSIRAFVERLRGQSPYPVKGKRAA